MKLKTLLLLILSVCFLTIFLCEFLIYYFVLAKCKWPTIDTAGEKADIKPVRAMLVADTHLLGPFRGHWWDKLRREWQMHRAFQTTITIHRPGVVFFLGDLFDEGQWVNGEGFSDYVLRFNRLFSVPDDIKVIAAVGNHDVGFHYKMLEADGFLKRFNKAYNLTSIKLHTIDNVHFVTINSMAMENDGCRFCNAAQRELERLHEVLECSRENGTCKNKSITKLPSYSRPILMQHFPTYRKSDLSCTEGDIPEIEIYRENWEVLSIESTDLLGKKLNPRVLFSGHSHHYCKVRSRLGVDEYTLASFSWRNKNNPSFILALFTPDRYAVSLCYLPEEDTVILIYMLSALLNFLMIVFYLAQKIKRKSD